MNRKILARRPAIGSEKSSAQLAHEKVALAKASVDLLRVGFELIAVAVKLFR